MALIVLLVETKTIYLNGIFLWRLRGGLGCCFGKEELLTAKCWRSPMFEVDSCCSWRCHFLSRTYIPHSCGASLKSAQTSRRDQRENFFRFNVFHMITHEIRGLPTALLFGVVPVHCYTGKSRHCLQEKCCIRHTEVREMHCHLRVGFSVTKKKANN